MLCYSLLPKAFDFLLRRTESIVVVASPLTQEQVRKMCERNIRAVYTGGADDTLEPKQKYVQGIPVGVFAFVPLSSCVRPAPYVCTVNTYGPRD